MLLPEFIVPEDRRGIRANAIRCRCLLVFLLLLAGDSLLNASPLEDDYQVTVYTVEDGLPENSVLAIEQSADGYLWLASYGGLVRFDGVHFASFDSANTPELSGSGGVYMLNMDREGCLWIVTDDWRVTRVKDGHFERYSGRFGLPDSPLSFDGEGPDGRVFFSTVPPTKTAFTQENGQFKSVSIPRLLSLSKAESVLIDQHGYPWSVEDGLARRMDWRTLEKELPPDYGTNTILIAHASRDGGMWAGTVSGLFHWKAGKWTIRGRARMPTDAMTTLLEDNAGNVWLANWRGDLWRVDPSGQFHLYTAIGGKQFPVVRALFEDREGNIWAGTDGIGLLRMKKRFCDVIDPARGLSAETIRSVACDREDRGWAISQKGLDCIDTKNSNHVTHLADEGLDWSVFCDSAARLWVGTYSGQLRQWQPGGFKDYEPTNVVPPITCLSEDDQKAIWLGTADGIWRTTNNALQRVPSPPEANGDVRTILPTQGAILVGTSRTGLWRLEDGRWTHYSTNDFDDARTSLAESGQFFIGTHRKGLWRLDGSQLSRCGPDSELPSQISCLAKDNLGWLWCGSAHGIFRIPINQIGWTNPTVVRYGRPEGLLSSECSTGRQPTVCKTSDGRIWFATGDGVGVINPAALTTNTVLPPVHIESALVFGSRGSPSNQTGFAVPPGENRLEIHYTAPSFTAPERVQFRFRLDGVGKDWTEAGTRRVAYFQGLGPGHYQFHVIACNNDGYWNNEVAICNFTVQPWFWQRSGFQAAVALTALAVLWLGYRVRLARLAAVNNLRLRIARDLHDEIGANLGSIGLNIQILMADAAVNDQGRRDLASIDQLTRQTAQAARDIVWMTNPDFDNIGGMIARMRELSAMMLAGRKWNFEEPDGKLSEPLRIELRRNVFYAFKECLHNIVKHSGAATVSISVKTDGTILELDVQDDGRGFDTSARPTGTGLRNLRRRVEELGGAISVASKSGRGTRVHLRVPIARPWSLWKKSASHEKS